MALSSGTGRKSNTELLSAASLDTARRPHLEVEASRPARPPLLSHALPPSLPSLSRSLALGSRFLSLSTLPHPSFICPCLCIWDLPMPFVPFHRVLFSVRRFSRPGSGAFRCSPRPGERMARCGGRQFRAVRFYACHSELCHADFLPAQRRGAGFLSGGSFRRGCGWEVFPWPAPACPARPRLRQRPPGSNPAMMGLVLPHRVLGVVLLRHQFPYHRNLHDTIAFYQ